MHLFESLQTIQRPMVGWMIVVSAILYLVAQFIDISLLPSAVCAWLSVVLFWPCLGSSAKRQAGALLIIGLMLAFWSVSQGHKLNWSTLLSGNLPLLAMFAGVSFLSLTNPDVLNEVQPSGYKGFWSTLLSCHLLGAVINLSIIFVVGDRLARKGRLEDPQLLLMMRSFCAAGFWSPFFVATGVVMTYAPGSTWQHFVIPGLCMLIPMSLINIWDVNKTDISKFQGYPLRRDSLVMPITLAIAVLIGHKCFPAVSMLTLITILAPVGALIFISDRGPRSKQVTGYIEQRLANISSQFALFLAAGIFSEGLRSIIACYPELMLLELNHFSPMLFMICSGVMIPMSLVGIHPVVSIAAISPFVQHLGASPAQLAFMFLAVWGISTASSPLSGVGLAMMGRYQATYRQIIRLQWRYMLLMWLSAGLINLLFFS